MLAGCREVEFTHVVIIHPPAYARFVHPLSQVAQPLFVNVKARRQHRHVKQRQHIFAGKAAIGQRKEREKGLQCRMRFTGASIGNRPRQPAFAAGAAENRLNIRAIAIDIRHHDDNIARRELGILFEHRQQPIVQHLNFSLWAMTNMNRQAAIVRCQWPLAAAIGKLFGAAPGHGFIAQFENVRLKIMQQVIRHNIDKSVQLFIAFKTRQQVDIVAPQLAPGGQ